MPRTIGNRPPKAQVCFKIDTRHEKELRRRGEQAGSLNEAARAILTDQFDWYGLPKLMIDALAGDAGPNRPQREYVVELLVRRYNEIVSGASAPRPALRPVPSDEAASA